LIWRCEVKKSDYTQIDWPRFRAGFAASLLTDNTYFAFDYGSRDHGGVHDWWFPEYYELALGNPLGPYTFAEGIYHRDFEGGVVIIATEENTRAQFDDPHTDILTGETGFDFIVPKDDARILLRQ
jgi:hypothetical protein